MNTKPYRNILFVIVAMALLGIFSAYFYLQVEKTTLSEAEEHGYTIQGEEVFWRSTVIKGMNARDFRFIGKLDEEEFYATDGKTVFVSACGEPDGCFSKRFESVDIATFGFVSKEMSSYALTRDKDHLYCFGEPLQFLTEEQLSLETRETILSATNVALEKGYIEDSCRFLDELFRK